MTTYQNLGELRTRGFLYAREFVAREARIASDRLESIESGDAVPTLDELDRLERVYGIDADLLEEEPIEVSDADSVQALPSLAEFQDVGDVVRLRIVEAATAAKDLVALQQIDQPDRSRWSEFAREAPRIDIDTAASPHKQGSRAASQLRDALGLGAAPVDSVRDLCRHHFPQVEVLHSDLTDHGPAGLAFVDSLRGPTIVLNTSGKNRNPCVRRVSLAHELGHLLIDWTRREPIASISGYLNEHRLDEERRANAFAVRLLCPDSVVRKIEADWPIERVLGHLSPYGLPYAAIRLHVRNEGPGVKLPTQPPPEYVATTVRHQWLEAEEEPGLEDFPLSDVPAVRRTKVASLAASLFSRGQLQRDAFARYLGVTPHAEVESVLDYFALDRPTDRPLDAA